MQIPPEKTAWTSLFDPFHERPLLPIDGLTAFSLGWRFCRAVGSGPSYSAPSGLDRNGGGVVPRALPWAVISCPFGAGLKAGCGYEMPILCTPEELFGD